MLSWLIVVSGLVVLCGDFFLWYSICMLCLFLLLNMVVIRCARWLIVIVRLLNFECCSWRMMMLRIVWLLIGSSGFGSIVV